MSTFMQKKEAVVRKWYVIDAAGKPMGRTAVVAADLLRGKNAPEFTPHVDCGIRVSRQKKANKTTPLGVSR